MMKNISIVIAVVLLTACQGNNTLIKSDEPYKARLPGYHEMQTSVGEYVKFSL